MSQAFSLYTELTVRQNLVLHARLFHLPPRQGRGRASPSWSRSSASTTIVDQRASELPLGIRQRLSLAVAVLHEPEILILDEPTSGVDPVARDGFWELLIDLSRKQGVTIFVSTHFMNEAERCDRISLMHAGRVLATDTPAEPDRGARRRHAGGRLHRLSRSRPPERAAAAGEPTPVPAAKPAAGRSRRRRHGGAAFSLQRLLAYTTARRWSCCAIRSGSASPCSARRFLMLVFGFGITTDVENLPFAVLDRDQSHESRAYLEELRGSRYFVETAAARRLADLEKRLKSGEHQGGDRDPAGLRPRHRARAAGRGRRLGRRRHAVPRRDDPRLSARACTSSIWPIRRSRRRGRRRRPPARYRDPVPVQPELREHLRDGAERACRCCWRCSRRS